MAAYTSGNLVGKVSTTWPVPAIYAKLWPELAASLPPGSQRRPAGHPPPPAPSGARRKPPAQLIFRHTYLQPHLPISA